MKKFGLFLIAAAAVFAFTSCNDDDGGEPIRTLITTVRSLDGGDYYFQRDNGETIYPSDKSRVPGYKPDPDRKQRAIIWFTLEDESIPNYRYNITLYGVENIYTGASKAVETQEELAALGTEPTGFHDGTFNLSRDWLTFFALYAARSNSKHTFTLAIDKSGTSEYEQTAEGYLNVELRHDAGGDSQGPDIGAYLSFDLTQIASELEGKKGVILLLRTRENGDKYIKLDLPQEK